VYKSLGLGSQLGRKLFNLYNREKTGKIKDGYEPSVKVKPKKVVVDPDVEHNAKKAYENKMVRDKKTAYVPPLLHELYERPAVCPPRFPMYDGRGKKSQQAIEVELKEAMEEQTREAALCLQGKDRRAVKGGLTRDLKILQLQKQMEMGHDKHERAPFGNVKLHDPKFADLNKGRALPGLRARNNNTQENADPASATFTDAIQLKKKEVNQRLFKQLMLEVNERQEFLKMMSSGDVRLPEFMHLTGTHECSEINSISNTNNSFSSSSVSNPAWNVKTDGRGGVKAINKAYGGIYDNPNFDKFGAEISGWSSYLSKLRNGKAANAEENWRMATQIQKEITDKMNDLKKLNAIMIMEE
jgi:hypothetical protein